MGKLEKKIYLASQSPRRRELLEQIGVSYGVVLLREALPRGSDVDESVIVGELPQDYVERVTRAKVDFGWDVLQMRRLPIRPILASDTSVVIDGQILGKPADNEEATQMLQSLSGRTHEVITSVALRSGDDLWQDTQVSKVTFAKLDDETIEAYCATSEPYDKAGGYGIQGVAAAFIESIEGSYSGIMGLPLFETTQLLREAGIQVL